MHQHVPMNVSTCFNMHQCVLTKSCCRAAAPLLDCTGSWATGFIFKSPPCGPAFQQSRPSCARLATSPALKSRPPPTPRPLARNGVGCCRNPETPRSLPVGGAPLFAWSPDLRHRRQLSEQGMGYGPRTLSRPPPPTRCI